MARVSSKYPTCMVQAAQTEQEPLLRLQALFGGIINGPYSRSKLDVKVCKPIYTWAMTGSRAVAVAFTLYGLMSQRRKEAIRKMVTCWKTASATKFHPYRFADRSIGKAVAAQLRESGALGRVAIAKHIGVDASHLKNVLRTMLNSGTIVRLSQGPKTTYSVAA